MVKKTKSKSAPRAVVTVGMVEAQNGYEVYDPNDDTATPIDVIAWLVNQDNKGANVTLPITTVGDAPIGWLVRYRGLVAATAPPEPEPQATGDEHADEAT